MTAAVSETDALLARIHETGYWLVTIRPTTFTPRRIPTLRDCERIIENASVRLRGWDYPHVDRDGYVRGDDWIQSGSDYGNHVELWRFYQSGQFIHHLSMRHDRTPADPFMTARSGGTLRQEPPQLDFVDVLYSLTEVLAFARGLAHRDVLTPAGELRVELHGTAGRLLLGPPGRLMDSYCQAQIDPIVWSESQLAAVLIAEAPRLALEATVHVLERFNWSEPPRAVLEAEQRRFLDRR